MDKQKSLISDESLKNIVQLNEDTLLVVRNDDQYDSQVVAARYISNGETHEDIITIFHENVFIKYNESMVGVFERTGKVFKRPKLVALYDVERHEFGSQELLKLDYGALSHDGYKVKQLNRSSK